MKTHHHPCRTQLQATRSGKDVTLKALVQINENVYTPAWCHGWKQEKKFEQALIHTNDEDSCAELPSVDASQMLTEKIFVDTAVSNAPCAKDTNNIALSTATQRHISWNFMDLYAKAPRL